MEAASLITVVVPVYNREHLLADTLRSIAGQTVAPSVVIVDNGSTDGSYAVACRWAEEQRRAGWNVETMRCLEPGAAAARNYGLARVETPWVMFFDSDDLMLPTHVERLASAVEKYPEIDIFGWDVSEEGLDGSVTRRGFAARMALFRATFNGTMSTLRYAARTSLVRGAGGWNCRLRGWDDYELGMRLLLAAPRRPLLKKLRGTPTVHVRVQEESISGTDYSSTPERWEASLDACAEVFGRCASRRQCRWLLLRRVVLAALYEREGSSRGRLQLQEILGREPSAWRRMVYRAAFRYTASGRRGVHLWAAPLLG